MMPQKKSTLPGVILIAVGLYLLLTQFNILSIDWNVVFPLGMLGLSAFFFISYSSKKDTSLIFPATILFVLGFFFFIRNYNLFDLKFYFYHMRDYWPVFLIAFGSGSAAQAAVKREGVGSVLIGVIAVLVGVMFLFDFSYIFYRFDWHKFWPIILILIGTSLIIKHRKRNSN